MEGTRPMPQKGPEFFGRAGTTSGEVGRGDLYWCDLYRELGSNYSNHLITN